MSKNRKSTKTAETVQNDAQALEQQTAPVLMVNAAQCAYDAIVSALTARLQYQQEQSNANQADLWLAEIKALKLAHVEALQALDVDTAVYAQRIAQTVKTDESFVAIYAFQKVRKICAALVSKTKSSLDGYTLAILTAMFENETLRNKTALVSLSRSIEFSEFDQIQSIGKRVKDCAPSTASTQASSTRKALATLQCAQYDSADKALRMRECALTEKLRALVA